MVAVGDEDMSHATPDKLAQILFSGLHGIDAEISTSVANEVAVKIVAVRFGKPRPAIDIC
jgi:hypothetical protein